MKVAIYCRLSEEDKNKKEAEEDSSSIQNQKTMLLQYAMEQGWHVYRIYSDDDYAGADRNRPEFKCLLEDARQHRFDIILCKTQSRFTRELELVEKYIHGLFPVWGIRFISIVDHADSENLGNKKSRQINGLVNEWYLEDMSENIRSVLTNRRKNGFHIGAFALYGYKKDPQKKGHLLVDEEAAAVVREVFMLFSQGYGKTAIARILNDRGIPNPTEYKRLHGMRYRQPSAKNSTLWKYSAISSMLVNEIYIGNMVQGKYGSVSYKTKQNRPRPKNEWYIVHGTHEPIIDRKLWDRVQELTALRRKPFGNGKIGLFTGKVCCANCGSSLRSCQNRGKRYLQCSNRYVSKNACTGAFISQDKLEQLVLDELKRLSEKYLDRDQLKKNVKFCQNLQEQKSCLLSELAVYKKKSDEYSKGIGELYMDKVKGYISQNEFTDLSKEFSMERDRLKYLIMDKEKRLTVLEKKLQEREDKEQLLERYVNLEHLNRQIIEMLIDYIAVGKRISGTRDVPVEIHWDF